MPNHFSLLKDRFTRHPGWLSGLMIVGAMLWVLAWAVASPQGSTPDEDYHLPSIWCPYGAQRCPIRINTETGHSEVQVPWTVGTGICWAFDPTASGYCTLYAQEWEDTGAGPIPFMVWTYRLNQGQYPGGFYDTMNLFARNSGILNLDVFWTVVQMRVFNGLLAIGLLAGIAYSLPRSGKRLLFYSLLIVAAPMMIFMVASANPSSWSITGLLVAWFGSYAAFRQRSASRAILPAVLALVGGFMAANARTDSAAFLMALAVGVAIMHWRFLPAKHELRNSLRFGAGLWCWAIPPLLLLLGWYGFSAGDHSQVLVDGFYAADRWPPAVLTNNLFQIIGFIQGIPTPQLNWLDTPMPELTIVTFGLGWVLLAIWGWGASRANWQKVLTFLGLMLLLLGLPLYLLQISGQLVGLEVQQRYLLPLLPLVLAVSLWRPHKDGAPVLPMVYLRIMYVLAVLGQSVALHTQIRRFTRGLQGTWSTYFYTSPRLDFDVEWWLAPLSPTLTWLLGSLGFALLALGLFAYQKNHSLSPEKSP